MNLFDAVRILPPVSGRCRECGGSHDRRMPHVIGSVWYQMRFRQDHGRFASLYDAARHCEQMDINRIAERILRRGERLGGNGWISVKDQAPKKGDADSEGRVLVWHILRGLMLTDISNVKTDSCIAYWHKPIMQPDDAEELKRAWVMETDE